jgi:hypothetical protein
MGLISRSLLRHLPHLCEALPLSACGEGTKGRGCIRISRSLLRRTFNILLLVIVAVPSFARAQTADPLPYAAIACPMPDTMDQLLRDSANLKISKIRVNQAGYRPQDEKLFYTVGTTGSAFSVIDAATRAVVATGALTATGAQVNTQLEMKCYYKASIVANGAIKYDLTSPQISGTMQKGFVPVTARRRV